MKLRFHFTFEPDWRHAPMAYWVHVQDPSQPDLYTPPAPSRVANRGFALLRVEYGTHELVFSSPEQLEHCITVLSTKPLPTSRALSARRGTNAGPNGHWLSRLPADLKSPAARLELVSHLRLIYAQTVLGSPASRGKGRTPPLWPGLNAPGPRAS